MGALYKIKDLCPEIFSIALCLIESEKRFVEQKSID